MVAPVSAAWVVGGVYWAGRRDGTTRALAKEVLMSRPRKRIGLLTSGGDCPGINAVIRAVTKTAIVRYGYEVVGFEDGFLGLIEDSHRVLSYDSVSGILATGAAAKGYYDYAAPPPGIVAAVAGIEAVCKAHAVPLAAAALQFPLGHSAVAAVVAGARSAAEVKQNLALFETPIPEGLWSDLKGEGLLHADAPTPRFAAMIEETP